VNRPLEPDVCVIGAGSAGLTVAAAARAVGLSVVLIEKDRMGGECLNTGCVPSKALIAAARHAEAVRRAAEFGVDAGEPRIDYGRVRAHVSGVIASIAPHDSQARFEGLGATVIRAAARFVDARTVEAGERTVRAKRFVIATGSKPAVPDVPGLSDVPYLTNESVFDLAALPRALVVIGGGPIGLELAQAFRRLGSAVTVLEHGRALAHDDPDFAGVVAARLRREGVDLREETSIARVERDGDGIAVLLADGGRVTGSHLLVAAGRVAATDGLGLDAAGVRVGPKGIATDGAMRTANRRIHAIGDVAAGYRFTHWAGYQGGLVVRSLLTHWPHRPNPAAIAWATYTDPELAHVGLTEAEARERHGSRVTVLRSDLSANDRAATERETEGAVKIVVGPGGRILGADVVGPGAGETAALFALAVAGKLRIGALAGMVAPYPTLAEAAKRAAVSGYARKLENPLVRRLLGVMRRLL
jgi:pyruvate/2-oxoglutarate dehydrogenase complex dihydrolipoamide dehydrogenase (E3) component